MAEILGIDVSRWQGEMNWPKASAAGARFAFIRAGSISIGGVLYVDDQFQRNALLVPAVMPTGAYWYFRPEYSPTGQADYFYNLMRDKGLVLPPVADIETAGRLSVSAAASSCAKFVNQLMNLGARKPIIYTRGEFWNTAIGAPVWASTFPLWVARYANLAGPWSDNDKWRPKSWQDWMLWQKSADGNMRGAEFGASGSKSIDINFFNGDEAAFRKWAGMDAPAPPAPPVLTLEEKVELLWKEARRQGWPI